MSSSLFHLKKSKQFYTVRKQDALPVHLGLSRFHELTAKAEVEISKNIVDNLSRREWKMLLCFLHLPMNVTLSRRLVDYDIVKHQIPPNALA